MSQLEIQAEGRFTNADFVWIKADTMTTDVTLQGTTLTITHGRASYKSARAEVSGTIELSGPSDTRLEIPATLKSGQLSDYLAMFKQEFPITGALKQIRTTIRGPVSHLELKTSLRVIDGTAWQQSFDELSGELELADNRVSINSLTIRKNGGNIDLKGFIGFDLAFRAELTASDLNLRDIDALKTVAIQYQGQVDLSLETEGTLENPKGKADILFKNLSYNGTAIEDVTCDVAMTKQTIQVALVTFRKKIYGLI